VESSAPLRDFVASDDEIACEVSLRQCLMRNEGLEPAGHDRCALKHEDTSGLAEKQRIAQ
jgi:hypothetical protein